MPPTREPCREPEREHPLRFSATDAPLEYPLNKMEDLIYLLVRDYKLLRPGICTVQQYVRRWDQYGAGEDCFIYELPVV